MTSNGRDNPFWTNLSKVSPGDIVFSFHSQKIKAIGYIESLARTCKMHGDKKSSGWKVDAHFVEIQTPFFPKKYISKIRPHLQDKYAPLRKNGKSHQGIFFAEVQPGLAKVLISLLSASERKAINKFRGMFEVDKSVLNKPVEIEQDDLIEENEIRGSNLKTTVKKQLVYSRYGQGYFRSNVRRLEKCCRVTNVSNSKHLIASHIKPWSKSNNKERLDGHNGLFLTPTVDKLFDAGFISFGNDGYLLISPGADKVSLKKMGIPIENKFSVGKFTSRQKHFLAYHRKHRFAKDIRQK